MNCNTCITYSITLHCITTTVLHYIVLRLQYYKTQYYNYSITIQLLYFLKLGPWCGQVVRVLAFNSDIQVWIPLKSTERTKINEERPALEYLQKHIKLGAAGVVKYTDYPSSNPAEVYNYYCVKMPNVKTKNKRKRDPWWAILKYKFDLFNNDIYASSALPIYYPLLTAFLLCEMILKNWTSPELFFLSFCLFNLWCRKRLL